MKWETFQKIKEHYPIMGVATFVTLLSSTLFEWDQQGREFNFLSFDFLWNTMGVMVVVLIVSFITCHLILLAWYKLTRPTPGRKSETK